MADFVFSAAVTRAQLGLADLNINDGINYKYAGTDFANGGVAWERETVKSPFVEGEYTTNRRRNNVQERMTFEVFAGNSTGIGGNGYYKIQANLVQLIQAFTQDSYQLKFYTYNNGTKTWEIDLLWECEAADYQVTLSSPRFVAQQALIAFMVVRNPIPTSTWSAW